MVNEPDGKARQLVVTADYAAFDGLADFAVASVADWPRRDALRLVLVLEELFTNSIRHGYGSECDAPIKLSLVRDGHALRVRYEDAGRPVECSAEASEAATLGLGDRPIAEGGLGLWLVRHYVHGYVQERVADGNRTSFAMFPDGYGPS